MPIHQHEDTVYSTVLATVYRTVFEFGSRQIAILHNLLESQLFERFVPFSRRQRCGDPIVDDSIQKNTVVLRHAFTASAA
jgi:hypothetical protein